MLPYSHDQAFQAFVELKQLARLPSLKYSAKNISFFFVLPTIWNFNMLSQVYKRKWRYSKLLGALCARPQASCTVMNNG